MLFVSPKVISQPLVEMRTTNDVIEEFVHTTFSQLSEHRTDTGPNHTSGGRGKISLVRPGVHPGATFGEVQSVHLKACVDVQLICGLCNTSTCANSWSTLLSIVMPLLGEARRDRVYYLTSAALRRSVWPLVSIGLRDTPSNMF